MQEPRDGAFLVEPAPTREGEHVDAGKLVIGARLNKPLDRRGRVGVGHLAQRRKAVLDFAHARKLMSKLDGGNPRRWIAPPAMRR